MRVLRRFLARLKNFASRRQSDRRLREEIEEHLALETTENLRAGMTPTEARSLAVLKFGAVQAVREKYHAEGGLPLMENLLQDARYTLRMLVKSPGFASIAILTMALGIGATTAIFSVVDATLLHPLSYPEPNELVRVELDQPGVGARNVSMSVPEWKDLERSGIFEFVSPIFSGSGNLTGTAQPVRFALESVGPSYLTLLGAILWGMLFFGGRVVFPNMDAGGNVAPLQAACVDLGLLLLLALLHRFVSRGMLRRVAPWSLPSGLERSTRLSVNSLDGICTIGPAPLSTRRGRSMSRESPCQSRPSSPRTPRPTSPPSPPRPGRSSPAPWPPS